MKARTTLVLLLVACGTADVSIDVALRHASD